MLECFTSDERNVCWDSDRVKCGILECLCLNTGKRVGQDYGSNRTILERRATDCGNGRAEIKLGKVNVGIAAKIYKDIYITGSEYCVFEITLGCNVSYTNVISACATVPVFIKICREHAGFQVEIDIVCSKERIATYMLYRLRNNKFCK